MKLLIIAVHHVTYKAAHVKLSGSLIYQYFHVLSEGSKQRYQQKIKSACTYIAQEKYVSVMLI